MNTTVAAAVDIDIDIDEGCDHAGIAEDVTRIEREPTHAAA
jgi:hypothetical protein